MLRIAFILACFLLTTPSLSAAERPNIILMMCDDLGWGDVGFNGGKVIQTPNLDRMAKASLKFNRFYAQAPVCSPTRGSAITGRHPFRYGVYYANTGHMKSEELTVAELLREHGYATGHFGKWHLGTLTKTIKDANRGGPKNVRHFSPPQDNGFDVCFSTESKVPTFDPMIRPKDKKPGSSWDAVTDKTETVEYGTYYWNESGEIVRDNLKGDDSRIIMDRAIPFIESTVKANKPFFAIVWFHTPHLPVVAGGKYLEMYRQHEVPFRNYYGCVTAMDAQVGRLRSKLAELGASENTIICFCSDNGPEGNASAPGSAGHFRGRKRSLYEGGVRVPGLIEWPKHIQPGETDFPAVTSDYLPTIANVIGATREDQRPIDGISLLPLFEGKMSERPTPIAFQSRDMVALSDNRFKLIAKKEKWELYDLIEDPSEQENRIADKHTGVVASMKKKLKAWRASCKESDKGGDY